MASGLLSTGHVMSTAVLSALLESAREPSGLHLVTTAVVLLCGVVSALLLAFECGQYILQKMVFCGPIWVISDLASCTLRWC